MSRLKNILQDYLNNLYLLVIVYFLVYPLLKGFFQLINYSLPVNSLLVTSLVISISFYLMKPIKNYILSCVLMMEITFIGLILLNWFNEIRFVECLNPDIVCCNGSPNMDKTVWEIVNSNEIKQRLKYLIDLMVFLYITIKKMEI